VVAKSYFVYILANKRNGVLYIGITGNLLKRIDQHKNNMVEGFTAKYGVHQLASVLCLPPHASCLAPSSASTHPLE
jgi:predicted GIY-YIG superfamily endonuclease